MSTNLPRLLQLCSQALPVGAYAYSQGLESAITEGYVCDQASTGQWISGVLMMGLAELDLPAMLIAYDACEKGEEEKLLALDLYLQASRETSELLLEDVEMGRSLQRLLTTLQIDCPENRTPSFVTRFALAGSRWQIPASDLLAGFCYSWIENQLAVAMKSVPLGQSEAQLLIGELMPDIDRALVRATQIAADAADGDWCFGLSLPGLAVLSSQHEILDGRLYRS